ncbi:MAG TPA: ISLre2 family transposase, partial [Eubacterium sp.]|nr:ISLre2 family transposase [Eubacterium sp.]
MDIVTLLDELVKGLIETEDKFFENIKDFYSFETSVKELVDKFSASYIGSVLSSIDEQMCRD